MFESTTVETFDCAVKPYETPEDHGLWKRKPGIHNLNCSQLDTWRVMDGTSHTFARVCALSLQKARRAGYTHEPGGVGVCYMS